MKIAQPKQIKPGINIKNSFNIFFGCLCIKFKKYTAKQEGSIKTEPTARHKNEYSRHVQGIIASEFICAREPNKHTNPKAKTMAQPIT